MGVAERSARKRAQETAAPGAAHPVFAAAPESHRWTGSLHALGQTLRDIATRSPGKVFWRVLPRGAVVAMCTHGEPGLFSVQIRRQGIPDTDKTKRAWRAEVDIFAREMGLTYRGMPEPDPETWEAGETIVAGFPATL